MSVRRFIMVTIAMLMVTALLMGAVQVLNAQPSLSPTRATLENVRDYTPAVIPDSPSYAVDAGVLFAGNPGHWAEITTPQDIIVSAVAVDSRHPETVYIGAANELAIFRTTNGGANWLRIPLGDTLGGVTDIAVDGTQRLLYAGTDNAGLFRLRDVGSSVIVGGQLLLDEPVRQVATDSSGAALAFARTDTTLYRAENYGLAWSSVDNLHSSPTAIAIADTVPAMIFVGTTDRGVVTSNDGLTWSMANKGLGMTPGTRLHIDALALDPQQPDRLYVAASYLLGSTTVKQAPSQVATSSDGGSTWNILDHEFTTNVADLLPVNTTPGGVYALTAESRTPLALFDTASVDSTPVEVLANAAPRATRSNPSPVPVAWVIAALAALALGVFVTYDLHQRGMRPLSQGIPLTALDTQSLPTVG